MLEIFIILLITIIPLFIPRHTLLKIFGATESRENRQLEAINRLGKMYVLREMFSEMGSEIG